LSIASKPSGRIRRSSPLSPAVLIVLFAGLVEICVALVIGPVNRSIDLQSTPQARYAVVKGTAVIQPA
jgi:hypothetical protein